MAPEKPGFGKPIVPLNRRGDRVRIGDKILGNPVKEGRILPELLDNLRTLAIRAYLLQSGDSDSFGQSKLDDEAKKMQKKFPNEQPEEVWRRTIATIIGDGVSAEVIAEKLFDTSAEDVKTVWMGASPHENRGKAIEQIRDELLIYWTSAPQRA